MEELLDIDSLLRELQLVYDLLETEDDLESAKYYLDKLLMEVYKAKDVQDFQDSVAYSLDETPDNEDW